MYQGKNCVIVIHRPRPSRPILTHLIGVFGAKYFIGEYESDQGGV